MCTQVHVPNPSRQGRVSHSGTGDYSRTGTVPCPPMGAPIPDAFKMKTVYIGGVGFKHDLPASELSHALKTIQDAETTTNALVAASSES